MGYFVAVVAVLALCQGAFGEQPRFGLRTENNVNLKQINRAFEQTIIDALECVREELIVGNPEWGVPPCEPLDVDSLEFDLTAAGIEGVSGIVKAVNAHAVGLTKFEVSNVKGSIGLLPPSYTVKITLTFKDLSLATKYNLDIVTTTTNNVFGDGDLSFEVLNFAVDVDLKALIVGGITLEHFNILPCLEKVIAFELTGLRNDEEYSAQVSQYVRDNGPQIIADNADEINRLVGDAVINMVNGGAGGEESYLSYLLDKCLV